MIVTQNPGIIDYSSIISFGVNVKDNENAIGHFGTGLKYAIAILLREGLNFTIYSGGDVFSFDKKEVKIRDKSFEFVTCQINNNKAEQLAFTLELGKNWQLWQAFREVYCNCIDENGQAFFIESEKDFKKESINSTIMVIKGKKASQLWSERNSIFLQNHDLSKQLGDLEVFPSKSNSLYYQKVKIHSFEPEMKSVFTYNITEYVELTEDRTAKNVSNIHDLITKNIVLSEDKDFIEKILSADKSSFEYHLPYDYCYYPPSEIFLNALTEQCNRNIGHIPNKLLTYFRRFAKKNLTFISAKPNELHNKIVSRAVDFLGKIGYDIQYKIVIVEDLGNGIDGLALEGTIYLALSAFCNGGTKYIASTILEEYFHLKHGYADLTRRFQTFLHDSIISMGEKYLQEPL